MKRLGTFIVALLLTSALTPVMAQSPVSVIGPVTPGNVPAFSSPTILKDSGVPASSSPGGFRTRLTGNLVEYVNGNAGSSAACGPTGALTCAAGVDAGNCQTPATACTDFDLCP